MKSSEHGEWVGAEACTFWSKSRIDNGVTAVTSGANSAEVGEVFLLFDRFTDLVTFTNKTRTQFSCSVDRICS